MVGPMSKSPDKSPLAPGRVHASPVLIVTLILAGALGLACTYAGVMLREAGSGTTTFDLIARGDREQRTGPWRQCPARGCARRFPIPGWVAPSFDHVLGDARLRDFEPELEQFAVDAWRAPKRIFDAHPPDQCAQLLEDLRSPSLWARLPTPVGAKAGPMPTHERVGPDDREDLQNRGNPAVELDKEPAIMVRKPDATMPPTPQDHQLMSKHRILSFKPQLRLERRGQHGQNETEQPDHSTSLGDSNTSSTRKRFSVHTPDLIYDRHN